MTLHNVIVDESLFDAIDNGFRTQLPELDPLCPMKEGDTVKFRQMRGKVVARSCVCVVTHTEALGDDLRSPFYIYSIKRRDAQ